MVFAAIIFPPMTHQAMQYSSEKTRKVWHDQNGRK